MYTNYNTIHVNYLSDSEYVLQSTDNQNTNHYPISYIVNDLFMNQITMQANAIFYKHWLLKFKQIHKSNEQKHKAESHKC